MKKILILKIYLLAVLFLLMLFEIMSANVLAVGQKRFTDENGVVVHTQTEKEYFSYFDTAAFERGNYFAFPVGVLTALTCAAAVICVITGKKAVITAASLLCGLAFIAELLQVSVFGADFITYHGTNTGMLLCALTGLMLLYHNTNSEKETTQNENIGTL